MPLPPLRSEFPRLPPEQDLRRRVKRELRKRALGVRKATPLEACAERSSHIVARLLELDAVRNARTVALFWPMEAQHEVDLRALDTALRAKGVRVAYPALVRGERADETGEASDAPLATDAASATGGMTFHPALPSELEERGFGFLEPPPSSAPLSCRPDELDVVVVPALAIDPAGQRIGYGKGYYDRALAMVPVVKIGVIFDFQLVSEVPAMEGDVAVDWIVTDKRSLRAVRPEELCAPSTGGAAPESPCPS